MSTISAKIHATPEGPIADFRLKTDDGQRSVIRRPDHLGTAEWDRPVVVKSYRELFDLVLAAGDVFAEQDVAEDARRAADHEGRRRRREEVEAERLATIAAARKTGGSRP